MGTQFVLCIGTMFAFIMIHSWFMCIPWRMNKYDFIFIDSFLYFIRIFLFYLIFSSRSAFKFIQVLFSCVSHRRGPYFF